MNVQTTAFVVGIALGALIIVCACVVWLRSRTLGLPGLGMTALAVLLVGASIWSSVDIELSAEGFKARVRRLEEQVDRVVEANLALAEVAQNAGEVAATSRRQVAELTDVLATGRPVDTERVRRIQRELAAQPELDLAPLHETTRILRSIPRTHRLEPPRR